MEQKISMSSGASGRQLGNEPERIASQDGAVDVECGGVVHEHGQHGGLRMASSVAPRGSGASCYPLRSAEAPGGSG